MAERRLITLSFDFSENLVSMGTINALVDIGGSNVIFLTAMGIIRMNFAARNCEKPSWLQADASLTFR